MEKTNHLVHLNQSSTILVLQNSTQLHFVITVSYLGLCDELSCFMASLIYTNIPLRLTSDPKWWWVLGEELQELLCTHAEDYIQPPYTFDMFTKSPGADGLNDRQFIDFPLEREVLLDDLKVPVSDQILALSDAFSPPYLVCNDKHIKQQMKYTCEGAAYTCIIEILMVSLSNKN